MYTYVNGEFSECDSSSKWRAWFCHVILITDVYVGDVHFKVLQHVSQQSLEESCLVAFSNILRTSCEMKVTRNM